MPGAGRRPVIAMAVRVAPGGGLDGRDAIVKPMRTSARAASASQSATADRPEATGLCQVSYAARCGPWPGVVAWGQVFARLRLFKTQCQFWPRPRWRRCWVASDSAIIQHAVNPPPYPL